MKIQDLYMTQEKAAKIIGVSLDSILIFLEAGILEGKIINGKMMIDKETVQEVATALNTPCPIVITQRSDDHV